MTFSVLISIYKKENPAYFDEAMHSIWDYQARKPDQIVLVMDGELTAELNVVITTWKSKLDDILIVVALPQNIGLGGALNEGLKYCHHELVARMDTDDICLPDRFAKQVALFDEDSSLDIVGCFALEIDKHGNKGALRSMPVTHNEIVNSLWASPIIHPSVMFKRNKIKKIGAYNATLRRRQDYELWFRCADQGHRFYNIPAPLLLYRFTKNTHTKQPIKLAFEQAMVGFKGASLLNMPIWKRAACFVPFFRSLLPARLQHLIYLALRRFDPRRTKLDLK
ncbi:glycosyltransferase [Photobacterium profundum]|uniref:glycosyltransferase n=1 Tax=Photobacterium profundum TaxID=74109 RepID=UPI003D0B5515